MPKESPLPVGALQQHIPCQTEGSIRFMRGAVARLGHPSPPSSQFAKRYPERCFDVGIAEQHA